jgi:hypothetical protein
MRRLLLPLAIAVIVRMAFQAAFVPAFEGADEPQHLARILDFSARPFREAFEARDVSPRILAAVAAFPCRPQLAAALGCPPYGQAPGAFDLLRGSGVRADFPEGRLANVEANQPPLFYMAAGLALRPFHPSVSRALLAVRLLCVSLVALALFGPLGVLARRWPSALAAAGLLALLLPGASEALARCSNDAAVFLWAALVLAALDRRTSGPGLVVLIAVGPLVKLTAIPVVVFAVVVVARERSRGLAAAVAAAALAVFPIQAWRGWFWGGTLELNALRHPIAESWMGASLGYLRSSYAFVKTTLWVGGMSRLRPPRWLVAGYGLWLAAALVCVRAAPVRRRGTAHAVAALAALLGFTIFALANRAYYGEWGGVGGWYLWTWSPWIAQAAADLGTMRPRAWGFLLSAEGALVVISSAVWLGAHAAFYGL